MKITLREFLLIIALIASWLPTFAKRVRQNAATPAVIRMPMKDLENKLLTGEMARAAAQTRRRAFYSDVIRHEAVEQIKHFGLLPEGEEEELLIKHATMTRVGDSFDYQIDFHYRDGEAAARVANLLADLVVGYTRYDHIGVPPAWRVEKSVPR